MKIVSYLFFNGNANEVINFYESVFDSKAQIMSFGQVPPSEEMPPLTEEQKKLVMHAALPIQDDFLFFSDTLPGMPHNENSCENITLTVAMATIEEAKRIYSRLAEGGKEIEPLAPTFWSPAFGVLVDKFGMYWNIDAAQ